MSTISERLRDTYEHWGLGSKGPTILSEAADTIDALVEALEKLMSGLPERSIAYRRAEAVLARVKGGEK